MEKINDTREPAMPQPTGEAAPFNVTEAARRRIATLLSDEPEGSRFCISVEGGGCSGFQYNFALAVKMAEPGDLVIDREDGSGLVLVEEVALPFLANAELDYVEDLASAGFEIKNPNAKASCGCGNSFSVQF